MRSCATGFTTNERCGSDTDEGRGLAARGRRMWDHFPDPPAKCGQILATIFALTGKFVGVNEALEDSIAAELVSPDQHGMAFGTISAVKKLW